MSYMEIWRKCVPCRRDSMCKSAEAGVYLECRSSSRRFSVAEGAWLWKVESERCGGVGGQGLVGHGKDLMHSMGVRQEPLAD